MITPVPIDLAIEKLRGFIADHDAEIINVDENHVSMKLNAICTRWRSTPAASTITRDPGPADPQRGTQTGSTAVIAPSKRMFTSQLQPIRNRDRRNQRARQPVLPRVISSLRSYLMGEIQDGELE